jgi:hypothetical protein
MRRARTEASAHERRHFTSPLEGEVGPRSGPGGGLAAGKSSSDSFDLSHSSEILTSQYDGIGKASLVLAARASLQ